MRRRHFDVGEGPILLIKSPGRAARRCDRLDFCRPTPGAVCNAPH